MPHAIPIRVKDKTYLALTQWREINLPAKPLANSNIHRFLKPGTCCKNNSAKNLSKNSLFVTMTCWNLGTKGYVSFDWGDAAVNNNNKTQIPTRHRSRQTQPQEGTLMPKTTKQRCQRDTDAYDFDKEAPKLIFQQQQRDANNENNKASQTVGQFKHTPVS